jgi:serine/threonine protein kinase/ribosomal protein L40E
MTISQKTTAEEASAGQLPCPKCNAALPPKANFCRSCGENLQEKKKITPLDEQDIQTRYRIKTLVRRFPHTNLYFALDNSQAQESGQTRMVAIRDIDVVGLEKEERERASILAQQEYDYLRRWNLPHTLACIDLRVFQGHLFLVSSFPRSSEEPATDKTPQRLYTLQDFLQSGLGLPREARTLEWVRNLSQAVERLHRHHIVLGDLDPYTVVLDKNSTQAEPRLMNFWLWPEIQKLLPPDSPSSTPQVSYFKAPEALAGKAGVRSDIYSLGALLYLLLTGTPPDESTLRHRRRLRTPREISSRVSQHVDDCVMRALAVEPEERFPNVTALLSALEDVRANQPPRRSFPPPVHVPEVEVSEVETVRIVPLSQKDVERWRSAGEESLAKEGRPAKKEPPEKPARTGRSAQNLPARSALPPPPTMPLSTPEAAAYAAQDISQVSTVPTLPPARARATANAPADASKLSLLPTTPPPGRVEQIPTRQPDSASRNPITPPPLSDDPRPSWPQRITSILPAIKAEALPKPGKARRKNAASKPARLPAPAGNKEEISLLKQIQRLILGQQEHTVAAAAIIETPMRVRPDQPYNLRLHIMGRDEPTPHPNAGKGAAPAGLSALVHGEVALVEVRSVLQQGYTYVLQHASVTVPANGYAAEVTIPMQQQTVTSTGRRDRLHIFFLDEQRHPLYEKPFVVEIFVSPLVQFGREGHQVLTIPI